MEAETRYQETRRVALLGAAKNSVLAALKIFFGIVGHSHALFADGIHSLSDLLIDNLVLIASRFGSKAADHDHPYGHGRIETAATVLLALVLILAGAGIIGDAIQEIIEARLPTKPSLYVFFVAFFSMLINEVLYHYTRHAGLRIRSNLLVTNAWHHRSDSATSIVVLLGVAAAWFGFGKCDAIAAVIVGLMIIYMGWQFGWSSLRELVDTGLDDELVEKIKRIIQAAPGVGAVHQLRTRLVGGQIFLDVHILVDSMISVSEGHYIAQKVTGYLLRDIPDIADITVHIDPEDDEILSDAAANYLPDRQQLVTLLQQHWQNVFIEDIKISDYLADMTLHYLAGKIAINLYLPVQCISANAQENQVLRQRLQSELHDLPFINSVKLFFVGIQEE